MVSLQSKPKSVRSPLTPLVELVALGGRNGWEIRNGGDGFVVWSRGAVEIVAKFAWSSQRPQHVALVNFCADEGTGQPQRGAVVFRGVGNGGASRGVV